MFKTKFKKQWLNIGSVLILGIILIFFICIPVYISSVYNHYKNIKQEVFRLHIVANSDTAEDQELKLKVRDEILKHINQKDFKTKQELEEYLQSNLNELKIVAEKVITDNEYIYSVTVQIGEFNFPTKTYGDIILPPGDYDALKIEIGEAKGENWWCVMFPPLCYVDVTGGIMPEESKQILKENLNEGSYEIVTGNNSELKLKLKFLEWFNTTYRMGRQK